MNFKNFTNSQGGVLLYVLIIWGIITLLLSLVTISYSSSVSNALQVQEFLQKDFLKNNLVDSLIARYKNKYDDTALYTQQEGLTHSLTRYQNTSTTFLSAADIDHDHTFFEFHKEQREIPFMDTATNAPFPNALDLIQNWKISWNLNTDITDADVLKYNSLQRNENAVLRITLLKTGSDPVKKCFNTSNPDVQGSIAPNGAFTQSLELHESFFKSTALTNDCTESDPLDLAKTLLNLDGANPLDFNNNAYILEIQALNGDAHVRVTAMGNDSYIPTNFLSISIVPSSGGVALEKSAFIAGRGSLIFSLLSEAELMYNSIPVLTVDDVTEENWKYFMGVIMSK